MGFAEPKTILDVLCANLKRIATFATSLLLAVVIAGCATTKPIEKEEPEPEAEPGLPKQEEKVAGPQKLLEFEKIRFAYDKATLNEAGRKSLKLAVDQLLERTDAKISIEGHCDERGSDDYNIDLGWKRAYAARDYMKRLGVDESRMFPISYGRARPAVIGHDETTWSRNRRVEIAERK